jgi:RimJ/RimL family protein N-acetyltransferase
VTAVPELHNDGIILNAHNDSEVAAHLAGEDEETARRFGWWPAYSTEETVRAAYANWARNWQEDGPVRAFAARDPGSGALVGNCELRIGPDGTGEVSYWTHAGKRGRGYARNALALLASYAASIGVTRLEAHVAPDNHASRRVAEAAGFTQAGTVTDGDGTEFIRYTRDASGDGAAPFTKLGPDPSSREQNHASRPGNFAAGMGAKPPQRPTMSWHASTGWARPQSRRRRNSARSWPFPSGAAGAPASTTTRNYSASAALSSDGSADPPRQCQPTDRHRGSSARTPPSRSRSRPVSTGARTA